MIASPTRVGLLGCALVVALTALTLLAGRVTLVRVGGGSMAPALWPGDLCIVLDDPSPSTRDVVLFVADGHRQRVLHRVRAQQGSRLVTQGDANPLPDRNSVARENVVGRVAAVVPIGRIVHRWQVALCE